MTMGAMLRFKRETGKEVTEMTEGSISDVATLLYCCIVSACKADKIPFNMTLDEFADSVSAQDMAKISTAIQDPEASSQGGNGEQSSKN